MEERLTKRRTPLALITAIVVIVIAVFEVFIMAGGFGLQPDTVKKYAPWAHESFLKFIGEHPDAPAPWVVAQDDDAKQDKKTRKKSDKDVMNMTGLNAASIPMLVAANDQAEEEINEAMVEKTLALLATNTAASVETTVADTNALSVTDTPVAPVLEGVLELDEGLDADLEEGTSVELSASEDAILEPEVKPVLRDEPEDVLEVIPTNMPPAEVVDPDEVEAVG